VVDQPAGSEKGLTENLFFTSRQESVRKLLDSNQLDGILFTSLENIRYLCGFTGSDGALVVTQQGAFFLTDSRYWTQAEEEVTHSEIVHYKKKIEGIASLLSDLKLKATGFESASLTVSHHRSLSEKVAQDVRLLPLEDEIKTLRILKDDHELTLIRKAIEIASEALLGILENVREGSLEQDIALEMEFSMRRNGADALGFDIITASGGRSALPHGKAGGKSIQKGDFIIFDYGARFQGYHSDETCTVVYGSPSPEQKKTYKIVKEAHDKAIEHIRPGILLCDVDAAARDHIRNAGYGDYFGHGLGHGVGLAVHEDPTINAENKGIAQEGMVFTIEPGIYIPKWGGVRIEDMVRVTSRGAELLTYLPKDLKAL
jgi:Xaa-Pro aminopeptidase